MTAEAFTDLQSALGDQYTLLRELGRGGMATVYLAEDAKHHRRVALKVLRSDIAVALGADRFRQEVTLAARLQHPHILTVYDSGQCPAGQLWFTMPYVEGESLHDRIQRQRQLPIEEAIRITREVALALDYAHRQGVIHRDIKPENILLVDGQPMLADFGIAHAIDAADTTRITSTGVAIGTPAYMSPEQASADRTLDARTDVYSLGAVLYEMLVGEPPFTGPTAQIVIARIMSGNVPSIRSTRPTVPPAIDAAVQKALAQVPADRYATAADFADALTPEALAVPAPAPRSRTRHAIGTAAALLLAAVAAYGLYGRFKPASIESAAAPIRLAVLPFDNVGDSGNAYFADGMTDAVRGKLIGIPGLEVIGSRSSTQYRRTPKSPRQIGQELGVRYLLVGKVRWDKSATATAPPSRVQVDPELIDVTTAADRWQQAFDAPLTDVFRVQSEIASQVAQQLSVALTPATRQVLVQRPTSNLDAYDVYLRGRAIEREGTATSNLRRAIGDYQDAVSRDSTFALAWAALSLAHTAIFSNGVNGSGMPPAADGDAAQKAAARAVAIAPYLPEAHDAMGHYFSDVRADFGRAIAEYDAALRLTPASAVLLLDAGQAHMEHGHWPMGLGLVQQAATVDPRDARISENLGYDYSYLRRYPDAIAAFDHALALGPTNLDVLQHRAQIDLDNGNLAAAQLLARAVPPTTDSATFLAYWVTGDFLGWLLDSAQLRRVMTLSPDAFDGDRVAWGLALAQTAHLLNDPAKVHAYADSARLAADARLATTTDQPQLYASRGLALAFLGRHDDAIRDGQHAVSMLPIATNAFPGPHMVHQLAEIYLLVGEPELAIDQLQVVVSVPYYLGPGALALDPIWTPLRTSSRFQRLIAPATPRA